MKNSVVVACLAICLAVSQAAPVLYYLHDQANFTSDAATQALIDNPLGIPLKIINCNQKQCQKYKVPPQYPKLVYWRGAGCSYKQLSTPTFQALQDHLRERDANPIKPIRDFLEGISLAEAFGVAFVVGTVLFLIFTALFKDRMTPKPKVKPI